MMQTVKGIYRDGKVELLEPPINISEGEVLVTFVHSPVELSASTDELSDSSNQQTAADSNSNMMRLGMFADTQGRQPSTEEDFKIAKFHGDNDDGLDWS